MFLFKEKKSRRRNNVFSVYFQGKDWIIFIFLEDADGSFRNCSYIFVSL